MFISLFEPAGLTDLDRVKELSVRAICSNRPLTEQLPVGETGADFRLIDNTSVVMRCIVDPTPPRDSVIHAERRVREATHPGPMMWRLMNLLALNHLGLADRGPEDRAGGLKEVLSLFADISDVLNERQVRGIDSLKARPVVRRLRQANGFNAARGVEITVTFDEKSFEGSGVMILGAVLDRFFAEYTSINSFTQTIIATLQRGVIMRWPPRSGMGGTL
jgi:type VI secretion system protein ImpG